MRLVVIAIFCVFIAIFIADMVVRFKNEKIFNEKLEKQMLESDEIYFEIRYLKNVVLLDSLVYVSLALLFIPGFLFDTDFVNRMIDLFIAVGLLGYALYIYFSKILYKIVFNHGRVSLYIGNKIKIAGTFEQIEGINRPTTISVGGDSGRSIPYQIAFKGGCIRFNENMDNSYKLVAFLEKGNYFKKTEK